MVNQTRAQLGRVRINTVRYHKYHQVPYEKLQARLNYQSVALHFRVGLKIIESKNRVWWKHRRLGFKVKKCWEQVKKKKKKLNICKGLRSRWRQRNYWGYWGFWLEGSEVSVCSVCSLGHRFANAFVIRVLTKRSLHLALKNKLMFIS